MNDFCWRCSGSSQTWRKWEGPLFVSMLDWGGANERGNRLPEASAAWNFDEMFVAPMKSRGADEHEPRRRIVVGRRVATKSVHMKCTWAHRETKPALGGVGIAVSSDPKSLLDKLLLDKTVPQLQRKRCLHLDCGGESSCSCLYETGLCSSSYPSGCAGRGTRVRGCGSTFVDALSG